MEVLELDDPGADQARRAVEVLEDGGLVLFPRLPFDLGADEISLLDPAILADRSKNVSLDPATGRLGGSRLAGAGHTAASAMIARFSDWAEGLLTGLAPAYAPALQRRRASLRPGPVDTRVLSPRKDDRRLHVDAFPASPVQGRRILRVFANVDPQGRPRVWEVGEEGFEPFAARLRPRFRAGGAESWARQRLGLTRGRRTPYDAAMLELHDRAKLDAAWQAQAPRRRLEFPAGSAWIVCTDSVLHAALSGQHALEQTWLMPVDAMARPDRSPLRMLERMAGRALV